MEGRKFSRLGLAAWVGRAGIAFLIGFAAPANLGAVGRGVPGESPQTRAHLEREAKNFIEWCARTAGVSQGPSQWAMVTVNRVNLCDRRGLGPNGFRNGYVGYHGGLAQYLLRFSGPREVEVTWSVLFVPNPSQRPPMPDAEVSEAAQFWANTVRSAAQIYQGVGIRFRPELYVRLRSGTVPLPGQGLTTVPATFAQTVSLMPGRGRSDCNHFYRQQVSVTAEVLVAHEFGHHLGLVDEYSDPDCPDRRPTRETGMPNLMGFAFERQDAWIWVRQVRTLVGPLCRVGDNFELGQIRYFAPLRPMSAEPPF